MAETQEAFYNLAPLLVDAEVDGDGRIEFSDRRFVFFHSHMFAELFEKMEDVAGPVINQQIKKFGYEAGQNIGEKMDESFKDTSLMEILKLLFQSGFDLSSLGELSDTDDKSQILKIAGYAKHVGWLGDLEFEEYDDGVRSVIVYENSFEAYSHGETGEKECIFLRHVMRGIFEYYWNQELTVEETRCISEGSDNCRVVIESED
jgi:predicted hydrocarbon binding protein